jgi:hypothetical protein
VYPAHLVAAALAHLLLEQLLEDLAHRAKAMLAVLDKTAHLTRTRSVAAVVAAQAQAVSTLGLLVVTVAPVRQVQSLAHR